MVSLGRDGRWFNLFGCNADRRSIQRTRCAWTSRDRSHRARDAHARRYSSLRHLLPALILPDAASVVGRIYCMVKKILLTGRPGCGKTTLVKRVVNQLSMPASGFLPWKSASAASASDSRSSHWMLPRCFVICQERGCLAFDIAHHVMHEFRQSPRFT